MFNAFLKFFGFDDTEPPPPPPRKSARLPKPVPVPVEDAEPPRRRVVIPRGIVASPSTGEACRIFAQSVQKIPGQPSPARIEAARETLGEDAWAYLTALALTDGQIAVFLLSEASCLDAGANEGLRERLAEKLLSDLDTWKALAVIEKKRRDAARLLRKPLPDLVNIPTEVEVALAKDLNARARLLRGKGGGTTSTGGNKATPASTRGEDTGRGGVEATPKDEGAPEARETPDADGDETPPKP